MLKDNPFENLLNLQEDYKEVDTFLKNYNNCSIIEFDYHLTHHFNLYTHYDNFDFSSLESNLDLIANNLSSLKRIASSPIIRLKDDMDTLPIEAVFKINYKTLLHASNHSELFSQYYDSNLLPRKLLTYINVDEYSIYENVGYVFLISKILEYLKRNLRIIKDMLYTNKTLDFNALERIHHTYYFLALGKLQTSYLVNLDKQYDKSYYLLNKLNYLKNSIDAHLINPIFKKVKVVDKFSLKKTNIFLHQKDYKKVYNLLRIYNKKEDKVDDKKNISIVFYENYLHYLKILFVFAICHFNFKLENQKIDFNNFDLKFNFQNWSLNLRDSFYKNHKGILLKIKKETEYKIFILPYEEKLFSNKEFIEYRADEIVFASYFEKNDTIYISNNNLNSFQRLQQIIQRAMIYSDYKKETCPFCGNSLERLKSNKHPTWLCSSCHNKIISFNCKVEKKKYFATTIDNFHNEIENIKDEYLYSRYVEGLMFYRNITSIDNKLNLICPYCKKIHY